MNQFRVRKTSTKAIYSLISEHIEHLTNPMDSWLEDTLEKSYKYKLIRENEVIGYAGLTNEILQYFYVKDQYFRYAPTILEEFIKRKGIKKIFVMTQDSKLHTLISEWDFDK